MSTKRLPTGIWVEVAIERERAHALHGENSMESCATDDLLRLTILLEEVGEVAREFNQAAFGGDLNRGALRDELLQVAAMAGAWADALMQEALTDAQEVEEP